MINLNKRGDSIEVKKYSHGMIFDRKYNSIYNSEWKRAEIVGYLDIGHSGSFPLDTDSTYQTRRKILSKQVSEIYKYDKNGYIVNRSFPSKDLSDETYSYKYNSEGDLIECDFYFNPKLITEVTKFTFDQQHLVC